MLDPFRKIVLNSFLKNFKCIRMNEIVKVLHPDRTFSFELYVRHHLANEYMYYGPFVKCPLCLTAVNEKTLRNWVGWIASGMRYFYRIYIRRKIPLWYLSV